jgi:amino acid transporter
VALGLSAAELNSSAMGTADAASNLWGSAIAGQLLVLGGIGGILTSWNAFVLGASRLMYAMARDGMLPSVFARLHPRWRTPHIAIITIGGVCALAPLAGRTILVWLVDAGSFTIVIAYIFVSVAFLTLRKREPDMPRPLRLPGGVIIGRLALIMGCALFCLYLPFSPSGLLWPQEWLIVLTMLFLGIGVFLFHRRAIDAHASQAGSL